MKQEFYGNHLTEKRIQMNEQKEEKQKIEVNNNNNFTYYFWSAGWLFTLGIYGGIAGFETADTIHKVIKIVASWAFWPYILGTFFAK